MQSAPDHQHPRPARTDKTERPPTLLRARWVAPMSVPPIPNGAVVMAGNRVVAVGDSDQLCRNYRTATVIDLGQSTLLPGLINTHTHLELSLETAGDSAGCGFDQWLTRVRSRTRYDARDADAHAADATRYGVSQCLRFGVVAVADMSQKTAVTRPILSTGPLHVTSFGEVLGLGVRRHRAAELLDRACDSGQASPHLRLGIGPHAPYTVEQRDLLACVARADDLRLPLSMHVAEDENEAAFLTGHAGPLRRLWETVAPWQEPVDTFRGTPIRMALAAGLLDRPALLAHVNFADDDEIALLARGSASVVYCPRTHRYFGRPPHRIGDMLAAGVNVVLGTDSCASSPDLNLVDDLRLVARQHPEFDPALLWSLITTRAARAMNMHDQRGSIAPGMSADLVAFPTGTDNPLREILETHVLPASVWIDGVRRHDGNGPIATPSP